MRLLSLIIVICLAGCLHMGTLENESGPEDPPILAIEEVIGRYEKVATIETSRHVIGTVSEISATDTAWSRRALKKEASRLGADAVIFAEIRTEFSSFSLIPFTKIVSKGIAIRFLDK